MKRLTQIFQALLGVVALICTTLVAAGRLAWRTIRNWWKSRSKRFRRSIAAILILIPVGFVALVAYVYYDSEYGRWSWIDDSLSKNVAVHGFYDYKVRAYNRSTGKYTTPKVDWISDAPVNDSLAVYAIPDKRGYLSANTGRIVIDARLNNYCKAWVFSEGLAAVMKDGKIGFINARNEVVIPFKFDYTYKCGMYDIGYLFHNGYCIMSDKDGKFGLIDKSGNWVVEPEYDQIWAPQERGYRTVIKNGKYGILDSSLKLLYEAVFDYVGNHSETGGFILMNDGRMWQEDYEGNVVQPFMYESSDILSYPVNHDSDEYGYVNNLSDYSKYKIAGRYGIMNRITGKPVTPAIYDSVEMISHKLFEVMPSDNYGVYVVDDKGNIVSR